MCVIKIKCDLACIHSHSSVRKSKEEKKCVMQSYFSASCLHTKSNSVWSRNHSMLYSLFCTICQTYVSSTERSVSVLWYREKNGNRNRNIEMEAEIGKWQSSIASNCMKRVNKKECDGWSCEERIHTHKTGFLILSSCCPPLFHPFSHWHAHSHLLHATHGLLV